MGGGSSRRRGALAGARGATLVEYALIVAVLVFGSLGAMSQLDRKSGEYYEGASDDIGDLPQTGIDHDDGSVPSTSSTTTTTTTAPTTTTTSTTTSTTTTTTTTTTIPTTTTTTIPTRSTISSLTNISSSGGSTDYVAAVRIQIRHSTTGAAIANATVTVRMVNNAGSSVTRTCITDSTGRCSVSWTVSESRSPVTATVTGVSASPTWDGVQASILLPEP